MITLSRHRRSTLRTAMLCVAAAAATASANAQGIAPLYDLSEELRIVSDESSRDKSLTSVGGLTVLADGMIVLFHPTEMLARQFDSRGAFVRTFGGRGQGPGEFTTLNRSGQVGNELWVFDFAQSRIVVFSADGEFARTIPVNRDGGAARYTLLSVLTGDRRLVTLAYSPLGRGSSSRGADSTVFVVEDAQGNRSSRIISVPASTRRDIEYRIDSNTFRIPQLLAGNAAAATSTNGESFVVVIDAELWGGKPGQIRTMRGSRDGPVVTTDISLSPVRIPARYVDSIVDRMAASFSTGGSSAPISDAQRAGLRTRIKEQMYAPEFFPVVQTVLLGNDGTLWLRPTSSPQEWIVVANGRPERRVRIPEGLTLRTVSRDKIWATRSDANGLPIILRYGMKPAGG